MKLYEVVCYSNPKDFRSSDSVIVYVLADSPVLAQKKALTKLQQVKSPCCKGAAMPNELADERAINCTHSQSILVL